MNNRRRAWFKKGAGEPAVPIADALALMSFRKLNPAYSGPCVQVRRFSDNTNLDIGFVGDYVDTAAIASFCAGTTGGVRRWYDQSGNNNFFNIDTFTDIAAYGKIYLGGNFFIDGGKIGIRFTALERLEPYTNLAIPFKSCFALVKMNGLGTVNYLLFRNNPKADGLFLGGTLGGINGFGVVENNSIRFSNSIENLNRNLHTYIGTSPKKVYTNGGNLANEIGSTSDLNIGSISRQSFSLNGNIQELLIYSTTKDSERVSIETSINAYYSIY